MHTFKVFSTLFTYFYWLRNTLAWQIKHDARTQQYTTCTKYNCTRPCHAPRRAQITNVSKAAPPHSFKTDPIQKDLTFDLLTLAQITKVSFQPPNPHDFLLFFLTPYLTYIYSETDFTQKKTIF